MQWTTGQEVSIVEGAFAGFDGIVEGVGPDTLTVRITMYGREVPIEVPALEVRAGHMPPQERLRHLLAERMALAITVELNDWWVAHLDEPDRDGHLWRAFEAWRGPVMERRAAQRARLEAELASSPPPDAWTAHLDEVLGLGVPPSEDGDRQREALLERAFAHAQASKAAAEAR